jgi:hypothetical protein
LEIGNTVNTRLKYYFIQSKQKLPKTQSTLLSASYDFTKHSNFQLRECHTDLTDQQKKNNQIELIETGIEKITEILLNLISKTFSQKVKHYIDSGNATVQLPGGGKVTSNTHSIGDDDDKLQLESVSVGVGDDDEKRSESVGGDGGDDDNDDDDDDDELELMGGSRESISLNLARSKLWDPKKDGNCFYNCILKAFERGKSISFD